VTDDSEIGENEAKDCRGGERKKSAGEIEKKNYRPNLICERLLFFFFVDAAAACTMRTVCVCVVCVDLRRA
jgi:hypothetical protein